MMPAETNPFNPRDYGIITKGLAAMNRAMLACDRAERTGINCEEMRADADLLRRQFESLKAEYFPGQP